MVLEKYFGSSYEYSPGIHEIGVVLQNPTQTLILCNLINKLSGFNEDAEVRKIYGEEYHFYFDQKNIYEREVVMPQKTFSRNLKELSGKGLITYFTGRNNLGYNTTYYYLHLDKIKTLFNEGCKLLGKEVKVPKNEGKQSKYTPRQNTQRENRLSADKPTLKNIKNELKFINDLQKKLDNGQIDRNHFNSYFHPLKMKIEEKGKRIIINKNNNLWQTI